MEPDYIKIRQIKPLISAYIRKAQVLLKKSEFPDEGTIHDIRVFMKKSRALLELLQGQADDPYYMRNMEDLRMVGRILCISRDVSVYRKTLKEMKKEHPSIFKGLEDNSKLKSLMEKRAAASEISGEMKSGIAEIQDILNKVLFRIRFQPVSSLDPHVLLRNLESSFSVVSDRYLRCRNKTKPRSLHRFRKGAKGFLYKLYVFRSLNPVTIKSVEKKLVSLTLNLGKYNDLDQILKTLDYRYVKGENHPSLDELVIKIREKQDRYLAKVWSAAYMVFCPGQKLVNLLGYKILVI